MLFLAFQHELIHRLFILWWHCREASRVTLMFNCHVLESIFLLFFLSICIVIGFEGSKISVINIKWSQVFFFSSKALKVSVWGMNCISRLWKWMTQVFARNLQFMNLCPFSWHLNTLWGGGKTKKKRCRLEPSLHWHDPLSKLTKTFCSHCLLLETHKWLYREKCQTTGDLWVKSYKLATRKASRLPVENSKTMVVTALIEL